MKQDTNQPAFAAPTMPRHVAIIMDGNGRWATKRMLPRTAGHVAGVDAAKRVVTRAIEEGIQHLTLYAFSTENWRRAADEVAGIMALVAYNLRSQYDFYRRNDIRVRHIGDIEGLPFEVRREIDAVQYETRDNGALTVHLAINYGGRDEIVRAVNRWLDVRDGDEALRTDDVSAHLDLAGIPAPDLLIRTGGERRLSNFLLWECAYAELAFSDRLWPDWTGADLSDAVADFRARSRTFGATPRDPGRAPADAAAAAAAARVPSPEPVHA